jgi:hypothetical protein
MGAAEATHLQQLLGWAGVPLRMRLHIDSSAARSAVLRRGVGRIRHLEVKVLWIQDMTTSGRLLVDKIKGTENMADIGTKPLSGPVFNKLRLLLGLVFVKNVAGETDVCRVGSCWARSEKQDDWTWLCWFAAVLIITVVSGMCAEVKLSSWWRAMTGLVVAVLSGSVQKVYHDVEVRGPVTYKRKSAQPRFVASGEIQWGSWTRSSSTR